jgi:hypothetical protein
MPMLSALSLANLTRYLQGVLQPISEEATEQHEVPDPIVVMQSKSATGMLHREFFLAESFEMLPG